MNKMEDKQQNMLTCALLIPVHEDLVRIKSNLEGEKKSNEQKLIQCKSCICLEMYQL